MKLYLSLVCIGIALVIMADYAIGGQIKTDQIVSVERERQQYYNAARNHHYSYKLITNEDKFTVEEEFIKLNVDGKRIEYAVSPIFKEVNWYKLTSNEKKFSHSLRLFSGCVLPLLVVIAIIADLKFNRNVELLVSVLQVLLIANLLFLIY